MNTVLSVEPIIRLGFFAGVFALMAAWELLAPRRLQSIGRGWRWPNNLGVVVVDTLLVRFFFRPQRSAWRFWARRAGGVCSTISSCRPGSRSCCGRAARPRDLPPARALPCRAGALAAAPHAPRRPRVRRDHRRALPPVEIVLSMIDQVRTSWPRARRRSACCSSRCC